MKQALNTSYIFTPSAQTLNLSSISNFNIENLYAVIDITANQLIYAVGQPAYGLTSISGSTLTLAYNTTALSSTDSLMIIYDTFAQDNYQATQSITAADTASTSTVNANNQTWWTGTPTVGSTATFIVDGVATGLIEISGTWAGTLQVEVSVDGGVNWVAHAIHQLSSPIFTSSFTANVMGSINLTAKTNVRVRCISYTSGTAVVELNESANTSSVYVANAIKLVDGSSSTSTTTATIKAASVAPVGTDTAVVVALSPNGDQATAANQATEIASLASIATNTGASATAAAQATGNASLASIAAGTPTALGQQLMAASMSVAIASNQSALPVVGSSSTLPLPSAASLAVRPAPTQSFSTTFAKVQSSADSTYFTTVITGSGQAVSQSAGNLVITTGTTANAETILRSVSTFSNELILKYQMSLSQRIANQNFFVELVDVIGDGLAYTINSATSVTVTIPSNPFTSVNVGQSMYLGAITTAAAIGGRYAIASVAGNNVTFTVAGWPASGSGTLSLFGWNYYQVVYNGTTATNAMYDAQRTGWNSGFTTATINTTASPGHMGILTNEDSSSAFLDQLVASNTALQTSMRASRVLNIPLDTTSLYLQIRTLNGSTAPASTTTWTLGQVRVENYTSQAVSVSNIKAQSFNSVQPVSVLNTPATTISSGTISTVTNGNTGFAAQVADVASAAITTTTTSGPFTPTYGNGYQVIIDVTAVSGTTPTMDVMITESLDGGTNYRNIYQFPRITAAGSYVSPVLPLTGNRIEYVATVAGTTPSFTRSISRMQSSNSMPSWVRQIYDRTVTLTTLSSTTGVVLAETQTKNVQMTINIGAATGAPALQLQASDDAGATWYNIGSPLTAVASSSVSTTVNNVTAQQYRAIVTTAGSGVTAGYVMIRAF